MREAVAPVTPLPSGPPLKPSEKRFKTWRKKGRTGRRISETLWGAAVELCRDHPVSRVSRVLRLDYYGLRDRVHKSKDTGSRPDLGFVKLDLGRR